MKEELINNVEQSLLKKLDNSQLMELDKVLRHHLQQYEISKSLAIKEKDIDYVNIFISAKRIEGRSEKTLKYYSDTLTKMLKKIDKKANHITTDDLRDYLSNFQNDKNSSKTTIDNIRRIFSSFFAWLEDEDYVLKSPVRRIHKVKTGDSVKETYTDEELEIMRENTDNIRDLALIDMLSSTGIRVGELVLLDKIDINFEERECKVLGKGDKERIVYFDSRTKLHLKEYIENRVDDNDALFVSKKKYNRLTICGIEKILKRLGNKTKINKLHPHRFRRTLATMAIDKGMPIEQVQKLLGHKRIDTTLKYAMVKQSNVKMAHRKYIG